MSCLCFVVYVVVVMLPVSDGASSAKLRPACCLNERISIFIQTPKNRVLTDWRV
jgi:hypothetical protein